jgi:uncharacterized protein YkwD
MRSFAIATLVAAASAFPALYNYNADDAPASPAAPVNKAAVTVVQETDVYTTVYVDEAAPAPTSTKRKHGNYKPKSSTPAAPVVVVTSTPTPAAYTAPVETTPVEAAPVVSTTSSAAPVATAASTAPNDYAQTVVDHHNAHRANHSAPALVWDAALAATALKIANSCNYAHDT